MFGLDRASFLFRWALAALLALSSACGGGRADDGPYAALAPSGARVGDLVGVSSHPSTGVEPSADRDFELASLGEAGVSRIRTDFRWSAIEPSYGQFDFAGYDVLVDAAGAAGLSIDAILDGTAAWATPEGSEDGISIEAWSDFVSRVVARYADRVHVWEVWNEENLARFWKPMPNPRRYGELLAAGYRAVHAADPNATVLFGGLSASNADSFDPVDGPWTFLRRVAAEDPAVCGSFDALALHPYTFLQQPMPEARTDVFGKSYADLASSLSVARTALEALGCPSKPLHLTEVGWPDLLMGEQRQAAYLARGLALAAQAGVASFYWYTFWDGDLSAFPPTEDTFGLYAWPRSDRSAKPAWRALASVLGRLAGSRYAGDVGAALGWLADQRALAFEDDARVLTLVSWRATSDLDSKVAIDLPLPPHTQEWELFDLEGNPRASGDGIEPSVSVEITARPIYLVVRRSRT